MNKAQLEARVAELEAQLSSTKRTFFRGNLWANQRQREGRQDPEWTGSLRLEFDGVPHWVDVAMWTADPTRFATNPADFSLSLSPCRAEYAAQRETNHQENHHE